MQLYFREKQLEFLEQMINSVGKGSNFVLLFGKRKVGKTTLVTEHLRRLSGAYLTISSKSTPLQLADISEHLKSIHFTDGFIPSFKSWKELFEYIFYIAKDKPVNLVLDDFHNFERIEPEFFAEFKNLWDKNANTSYLNLIAITSDFDFIQRMFYTSTSELFQIHQNTLKLTPFAFSEVVKIMMINESDLPLDEIIKIYMVFGGLPKYYALLDQFDLWNKGIEEILGELVFKKFAPLGFELKEMIVSEFSRNNSVYLSILQAIAAGKVTVTDISKTVAIPPTSVIKYLTELDKKKGLVSKKNPFGTQDPSRSKFGKYYINNYFENFWFKFIQPDIINYEMGQYEQMLENVMKQLPQYIQQRMKLLVRELVQENRNHPFVTEVLGMSVAEISETWTREGELDMVITGTENEKMLLGSIFRSSQELTPSGLDQFKRNVGSFMKLYPGYETEYLVVTWDNPSKEFQSQLKEQYVRHVRLSDILMLTNYKPKSVKTVKLPTTPATKKEPIVVPKQQKINKI
ncbi:MAG: hypothetical protein LWX56_11555 [Ignavibacteria bacterium]|nr:hypothetical protein [Ignavibacteria bacterium]